MLVTTPTEGSLRGPYALLVEVLGDQVRSDLSPLPLVVHHTGFILPHDKPPRRVGGEVPLAFRRRTERIRLSNGRVYTVTIAGDSYLGLPYGSDWKAWLAILRWVDEEGVDVDGRLRGVSGGRLVSMAGLNIGGTVHNRMIEAVDRLRHVEVTTSLVYVPDQFYLDVRDGRRSPLLPGSLDLQQVIERQVGEEYGEEARERSRNFWILNAEIDRPKNPKSKSPGQLVDLRVNTDLLQHIAIGWTTWIHVATHSALTTVTSMRLYHLMASLLSEGKPGPFVFRNADLATLLGGRQDGEQAGSPQTKPVKLHGQIVRSLGELKVHGVIDDYQVREFGPRQYSRAEYTITPGLLLRAAKNLRGCGLRDTRENRILLAALNHYGIKPPEGRRWIREDEEQALEAVLYVLYTQTQGPAEKRLTNPTGFLIKAMRNRTRQTEVAFQRWLRSGAGELPTPRIERKHQLELPSPPPPKRAYPPASVTQEAISLYDSLREVIRSESGLSGFAAVFEGLAPAAVEGHVFVLHTPNSFFAEYLAKQHGAAVGRILHALTEGRVSAMEIRHDPASANPAQG